MIKKITFISATVAMFLLSGCSTKGPAIDASADKNVQNQTSMASTSNESSAGINPTLVNGIGSSGINPSTSNTDNVIAPITKASSIDATNAVGSTSSKSNISTVLNGSDGALVSIFFDYDKFDLRDDMQEPMARNSTLSKGKMVKLEGNCDEFGSDEYNIALGLKRAAAIKDALINSGVNPDSISMVSLGESNPICLDKNEECWAKNRRVDFKLP